MPDSDDRWHIGRIAAFLLIGLALYAGLFLWSDATLRRYGRQSAFLRIALAPSSVDWIILGASHALPLGFADMPAQIKEQTGQQTLTLAVPGGGPFPMRLIGERWFADHRAKGVLIVLDAFGFADPRWNAARLGDSDVLPKMPADRTTSAVLGRAIPRGLPWQTWAAQATGFARINDPARFQTDDWVAADKFAAAPRPSAAATRARIAFLYPGPVDPAVMDQGFADLEALIRLAQDQGARVVIVRPPLPDAFRNALPEIDGFEARLADLSGRLNVLVDDQSRDLPEPQFYFDSDHLNRAGVLAWVSRSLGATLAGSDDGGQ